MFLFLLFVFFGAAWVCFLFAFLVFGWVGGLVFCGCLVWLVVLAFPVSGLVPALSAPCERWPLAFYGITFSKKNNNSKK